MTVIGAVLEPGLRECPDAPAVIGRSGTLTYRALDDRADRAAAALWSLGVRKGDRVAVCLPNDLDVVVAFHAAMRVGALWVGIGEALVPVEKRRLIADCDPAVYLSVSDDLGLPTSTVALTLPRWSSLVRTAAPMAQVAVDPDDPAGIAYTSGTTGEPKGIVHSHRNLLLPGEVLVASRGWDRDLRKGDCLPLTILNMLVLTTLTTAQARGCCIVMDRRDHAGIAEWIDDAAVTHWNGVPAQLRDLASQPPARRRRLDGLQEVWSGGADCSDELRHTFGAAFGRALRSTYGLTEAPTVVAIDPVGDDWVSGASGRVLPHLDVWASGPDGARLEPGEVGELTLGPRRDGPFAGRWTPALGVWTDGRIAADRPGPVATGDLGSVDAAGWLRVLDRRKLVVVRGGANVYPAEVERVLLAQPGVTGAAVFGVPDERLGERVAAVVEGDDVDVDALRTACAEQLSRYKVPERWGVVGALPRNAMGKVVRPGLADLLPRAEPSAR